MKWFCRKCWRSGEMTGIFTPYQAHRHQVDSDMKADKVPTGMNGYRNHPMMEKYPSVDCEGDIEIGEEPKRKSREKSESPPLDFGDEGIVL